MAKSKKVEARERARAAKARVDARRAARDEEITKVQTAYFVAVADRDEALEAQAHAEQAMARAIAELNDRLGVRVDEIAELCEISQTDVRAFKRRAPQVEGGTAGTEPEPGGEAMNDSVETEQVA